ncbi:Gfo/Idh/MocA family protein [Oerskovia flava]|uniref:Gfo/Idh/MocA family protein n=1 Tax=Oerskovia flava TaxID=2986422 RepID=UPI00223ED08A|nr:Gfo/Idh/MocA family oxidoreductase [Oerskovia sp. JB1-3-2]
MPDLSRASGTTGVTRVARVALVGAHGHGASHLRRLVDLHTAGTVELVAVVDPQGPGDQEHTPSGTRWFAALDDLLDGSPDGGTLDGLGTHRPDVVVLCTPIPTHVPLATAALRAGCDVLLEKPPTPSLAEHEVLVQVVAETGRRCQVGFQTFGSTALDAVARIVADGEIGDVVRIGAVGTWVRTAGYWARAPWAGRRRMGGRDVVDGVVTNPLAHAVATALRVAGVTRAQDVASVEVDLYRANPIEADDTSSVRVVAHDGTQVACGLTLCAEERTPARVVVHGTLGTVTLGYETDVVHVDGTRGRRTEQHTRIDLLADLLAARQDPDAGLLCDLRDTGAFTRVLEAVRTAPGPTPITAEHVTWVGEDDERRPVVHDVAAWCEEVSRTGRTFRDLGAPWAAR